LFYVYLQIRNSGELFFSKFRAAACLPIKYQAQFSDDEASIQLLAIQKAKNVLCEDEYSC
jgi:hypothetical protein